MIATDDAYETRVASGAVGDEGKRLVAAWQRSRRLVVVSIIGGFLLSIVVSRALPQSWFVL